jgi:hypothetical protein
MIAWLIKRTKVYKQLKEQKHLDASQVVSLANEKLRNQPIARVLFVQAGEYDVFPQVQETGEIELKVRRIR